MEKNFHLMDIGTKSTREGGDLAALDPENELSEADLLAFNSGRIGDSPSIHCCPTWFWITRVCTC